MVVDYIFLPNHRKLRVLGSIFKLTIIKNEVEADQLRRNAKNSDSPRSGRSSVRSPHLRHANSPKKSLFGDKENMATSEKVGSDEDDSIRLRQRRSFQGELIRKNALFLYKREQQAEHGDIFLSNSIAINNYYTEHTWKKITGPLVSGLRTFGK